MFSRFIARVEGAAVSFPQWIAGFVGVIFIRFFLENISSPTPSFPSVPDTLTMVHYGMFYLAAILLSILILRIFIPDIAAISKFLLAIFPIIWLPPLIDLAASGGLGAHMAYVFASGASLWQGFFTLGGSWTLGGITPGIKIELAIILCGIVAYVFIKTGSIRKAIGAAVLAYLSIFLLIALPSFLAIAGGLFVIQADILAPQAFLISAFSAAHMAANFLRPTVQLSYIYAQETVFNLGMAQFFYLFNFLLIAGWLFFYRPRMFSAFLKNIRPGRIIHFIVMIVLGALAAIVSQYGSLFGNWVDAIAFVNIIIAYLCAWLFAVGVNDIADIATDRISNAGRPLVVGAVDENHMRNANIFFIGWSLLGGFLGGYWTFFTIAIFTAAYYVYSASPLRLKRIPLLATFLIAIACLSAAMAGFYFVSNDKTIMDFPPRIPVLILVFFTLMLNVKDIKDVEGDRLTGVKTIPVLAGAYGKEVVGGLFAAAFLAIPIILASKMLFPISFVAAILGYVLINTKPYREWTVFILYFCYLIMATVILWPH